MSKEGLAIINLEDAVEVHRPRGETELNLAFRIRGTDEETTRVARDVLDDDMNSLGFARVERGSGNSRQFFYSEKTWSAPWNPKGPKPPWAQNPENN